MYFRPKIEKAVFFFSEMVSDVCFILMKTNAASAKNARINLSSWDEADKAEWWTLNGCGGQFYKQWFMLVIAFYKYRLRSYDVIHRRYLWIHAAENDITLETRFSQDFFCNCTRVYRWSSSPSFDLAHGKAAPNRRQTCKACTVRLLIKVPKLNSCSV